LLSNYNNNGGYKAEQIANKTFELALPIGIQWQVVGKQKLGLNAEASIQPTYILGNNAMLLSTDFKNYTDGSAFARRWNVNTSIGVNLTFKTG
ncbi:hypothetical protein ACKI1K_44370, partial [Streptomyces scabiei]|uniref:hypothetical protein n=1 Tax=Streptomyces scabiei TaxID=1930 RepID=UPI0038F63F0B